VVPWETFSFVYPADLDVRPSTSSRETSILSGKQNLLFPNGPVILVFLLYVCLVYQRISLTVKCKMNENKDVTCLLTFLLSYSVERSRPHTDFC